ncbi:hypothetical protein KAU51_01360 [Candidatus Parcubacteria bacterium]|nr:hypothetical protein [Candidatus Parcubacteria bacterium]
MSLDEIKNLIKIDGGKFIIVENGEPVLMVMSFDDYKKIIGNSEKISSQQSNSNSEKEIPGAQEVQEFNSGSDNEYAETVEKASPQTEESLKIEDLPV